MSEQELTRYTIRPDGTALYVPVLLADHLGIRYGQRLTAEQFGHAEIQGLIERRLAAQGGRAAR